MYLGLLVCKTYIQQENLKSYKLTMPLKIIAEVINNHSKYILISFKNSHKSKSHSKELTSLYFWRNFIQEKKHAITNWILFLILATSTDV